MNMVTQNEHDDRKGCALSNTAFTIGRFNFSYS